MNREQFTDTLHRIVEKDIPDDMDKLNAIRDAIAEREMIRTRRTHTLSRIAAIIIVTLLLMVGSVVAYAVYQALTDPGLESAIEQGLVQEINQSQTIDSVTVIVKQAYADTTRVAIWYTFEVEDQSSYDFPLEQLLSSNMLLSGVFDSGGRASNLSYDLVDTNTYLTTFNHTLARPDDGVYHFEFQVAFGAPDQFAVDLPDNIVPPAGEVADEDNTMLQNIGPFTFDLDLIAREPVLLMPDTTITANGLDVTLKSVEVAPSQANIELCYELPDGSDWLPNVKLVLDNIEGLPSGYGLVGLPNPSQTNRCVRMQFFLAYTGEELQLSILVDGLKTSSPEWTEDSFERAKTRLAEQGVIVEFSLQEHGFNYATLEKPDSMDEYDLNMAVFDALSDHYDGEWHFTLDLP